MTPTRRRRWTLSLLTATAITLGGCATIRKEEARDTGALLVSAGFAPKRADTPARTQQLESLTPLTLVSQPIDGRLVYRYADPYSCHCLYVGDERAYATYKRLTVEQEIADARLEAEAAAESDAVDWDLWGGLW